MTAAIGQSFSQITAGSASGGSAGPRNAESGGAASFGDLVHGDARRGTQTAPARSGAAKDAPEMTARNHGRADPGDADPPLDGQASARTRRPHKNGGDDPAGDESNDKHRPEAAGTGDVQPLRDRLPLLATLNGLGAAVVGPAANDPPASAGAGERSGARRPNDAGLQITPRDPATDAIASVTKGGKSLEAAAASPARQGRQAEDGTSPSGAGKPSAAKNVVERLDAMVSAAPMPAAPADGPQGGGSRDGEAGAQDSRAARAARRVSARAESPQEPDRLSRNGTERRMPGPVNVVAERSFPAPAVHPLSHTTAGVVDALAAMGNQAPASALSQPPQVGTVAHPAHVLRIELHPVELGVVTASLRMSGEQLSIELKPETAEAYRHLAHDSDTIVKSLRKLGLDIDSVTVIQPSIATQPAARADTGNQASAMPGRDAGQFQPGTSGGSGDGFGGQQPGRNHSHDGQPLDRPAPAHRERARGSLFI